MKDRLLIALNNVNNRLCNSMLTKESYQDVILELNELIKEILVTNNYDYNKVRTYSLFKDADVRLATLQNQLEKFSENSKYGLNYVVDRCRKNLNNFLSNIYIGRCKNIEIENNHLNVTISCALFKPSSSLSATPISDSELYETKIKMLETLGLKTDVFMNVRYICFDDNAVKVISEIMNDTFEIKNVEFNIQNRKGKIFLKEISFACKISNLLNYEVPEYKPAIIKTEYVNADEAAVINKTLKEIASAYSYIEEIPSMIHDSGYIIESYFCQICDVLDIETDLTKEFDERKKEVVEKNKEIYELESTICNLINADTIRQDLEEIRAKINNELVDNLSMRIDLMFHEYGRIRGKIHFISSDFDFVTEKETMPYSEISNIFDVVGTREEETLAILDNEKNRRIILDALQTRYPNMVIESICSKRYNSDSFCISEINIVFDNIEDLI